MTPEEYLEIERAAEYKSEYLDGQMFAMAGASRIHVRITWNLNTILGTQLRGKECAGFGSDQRVRVPGGNFYAYPDISVACGPKFADDKQDILINPVLIIEVLSPTSRDYDCGIKLRRYQTIPSFVEYLLVEQEKVRVEHWMKQPDSSWLVREIAGLESEVALQSIGCRIRLGDVYEGVEIDAG